MKRVAIVNYGMGNLDSVARAVEECGGHPVITSDHHEFETASYIILPGVGAFADGMKNIRQRGLDEILTDQVIEKGIPCLGLCLGMQLLASTGDEGGGADGLGWIDGEVRRLEPPEIGIRIPHAGWNEVRYRRDSPLFSAILEGSDFYFVHSYHFKPRKLDDVLAVTPYCGEFVSVVGRANIFGVQFHPEKSQRVGFQLIRNFLAI